MVMSKLSRVNTALLLMIILVNGFTIIAPLAPNLWFWWESHHSQRASQLTTQIHQSEPSSSNADKTPQQNRVIIPSMLLDQPIFEGRDTYAVLAKGIWRWPDGSTSDKGGNTVLIGHRFTYTNPRGVFYFLNKVQIGNEIGLTWQGKNYLYKVVNTKTVQPSNTSILNQTKKPTLTLYTCTPLWWPKERLVVTAELEPSL